MAVDRAWVVGLERAAEAVRLGQLSGPKSFPLLSAVPCAGRTISEIHISDSDIHGDSVIRTTYLAMREDPNWVVLFVPTGTPLNFHPLADALTLEPNTATTRAGHWTIAVVDRDGRRPGPVRLRAATIGVSSEFGRAATVALGRLAHFRPALSGAWDKHRKAEVELLQGQPALLRDAEMGRVAPSPGEEAGEDLFGAAWDLNELLLNTPAPPVSSGTWRLPDEPSRILRTRIAVIRSLTDLFLAPAVANLSDLGRRVRAWVVASCGHADRGAANDLVRLLTAAHKVYWSESVAAISEYLAQGNEDQSLVAAAINAGLTAKKSVKLTRARELVDCLLCDGRSDWAALLWAGSSTVPSAPDEIALVRRLRGFRLATGRPLGEAAAALRLTKAEARKLLARYGLTYRTQLDGDELWRAAYNMGAIDLSVFDGIGVLSRPERNTCRRKSQCDGTQPSSEPNPNSSESELE